MHAVVLETLDDLVGRFTRDITEDDLPVGLRGRASAANEMDHTRGCSQLLNDNVDQIGRHDQTQVQHTAILVDRLLRDLHGPSRDAGIARFVSRRMRRSARSSGVRPVVILRRTFCAVRSASPRCFIGSSQPD